MGSSDGTVLKFACAIQGFSLLGSHSMIDGFAVGQNKALVANTVHF